MRIITFLLILGTFACTSKMAEKSTVATPERVLRHVVMFKFKDGTTPAQVREIERAFAGLQPQLPHLIKDFEFGVNNSPEGLDQGLTHCFLVTFANEKDRDAYLPHPVHQKFVDDYAKKYVDKVTVLDYWSGR